MKSQVDGGARVRDEADKCCTFASVTAYKEYECWDGDADADEFAPGSDPWQTEAGQDICHNLRNAERDRRGQQDLAHGHRAGESLAERKRKKHRYGKDKRRANQGG